MPPSARLKNDVIQVRASAETKALFVRAAELRGQKLSEFTLESARQRAEETLLDQRAFFLDEEAHARFLALLDAAPAPSTNPPRPSTRPMASSARPWASASC